MVTSTGNSFEISESIAIISLILVLLILTSLLLYFGIKIEYLPFKIFLTSLGVLFAMVTLGVCVNIINNLLIVASVFSGTFVNLYLLSLILVSAGGIGLMVFMVYMSVKQFYSHRSLINDTID